MTDVLVVDDDDTIREVLEMVLRQLGYSVATAADGNEALEWLERHDLPSLVLLDWMMPGCDAMQFRRRQLHDARIAGIPVILLTADMRIARKQADLQVEGCLQKPVRLATLREVTRRYVGATSKGAAS